MYRKKTVSTPSTVAQRIDLRIAGLKSIYGYVSDNEYDLVYAYAERLSPRTRYTNTYIYDNDDWPCRLCLVMYEKKYVYLRSIKESNFGSEKIFDHARRLLVNQTSKNIRYRSSFIYEQFALDENYSISVMPSRLTL